METLGERVTPPEYAQRGAEQADDTAHQA